MQGVTVTRTKVTGFLLLFMANITLIMTTRSLVGFITAIYAMLSCLEYQILETGAKGMPLSYMGECASKDSDDIERGGV